MRSCVGTAPEGVASQGVKRDPGSDFLFSFKKISPLLIFFIQQLCSLFFLSIWFFPIINRYKHDYEIHNDEQIWNIGRREEKRLVLELLVNKFSYARIDWKRGKKLSSSAPSSPQNSQEFFLQQRCTSLVQARKFHVSLISSRGWLLPQLISRESN